MTKETVMNKLHELEFPKTLHEGERKNVDTLYIDADEDHVSLQYLEKKGVQEAHKWKILQKHYPGSTSAFCCRVSGSRSKFQ